jgi:hypothetical protein
MLNLFYKLEPSIVVKKIPSNFKTTQLTKGKKFFKSGTYLLNNIEVLLIFGRWTISVQWKVQLISMKRYSLHKA